MTIEEQFLILISRGDGDWRSGFETIEEAEAEARKLGYTHTMRWHHLFAIDEDGNEMCDPLMIACTYRQVAPLPRRIVKPLRP